MPKKRNREDKEDRSIAYTDARREQGTTRFKTHYNVSHCAQDLDQVEYAIVNNDIVYVVVQELTRRDHDERYADGPKHRYFQQILNRYEKECQSRFAVHTAEKLGCEAYIVVFESETPFYKEMERVWIYNLTNKQKNAKFSEESGNFTFFDNSEGKEEYWKWLKEKHDRAIKKHLKNKNEKQILQSTRTAK